MCTVIIVSLLIFVIVSVLAHIIDPEDAFDCDDHDF